MNKLIWIGCLSYLVIGMAHVVGGAVLEPMMDHYGLGYQDGGQWIMNQFLGFLAGVLAAPYLTRWIGRRNTVLAAMGSLTAAEAAYSLLPPWGLMLSIAPIAGFGFGLTEAVLGAIIIEFVVERKASAMTRLETFFGLGALAMPSVAALLIGEGIWQMAFPVVTAMAGITTLIWLTMSFGQADDMLAHTTPKITESTAPRARYSLSALPLLTMGVAYFVLYVGMEMSVSNYLPSIMKERAGMGEAAAASTLSLFWGLMVIGRLFSGRLADWSGYIRYLAVSTGVGAGLLALLAVTGSTSISLIWIGLSGLVWSGVFAIGLLYINEKLPGMTERTTSLLVAAGGLGGAAMPRITGWFLDRYSAGSTIWMLAAVSAVMLLLLAWMAVEARRLRGKTVET
ncbi:MFS transporter [Paenibacillus tarimensis]|uniref:MFS transporter n=1 Tax=Paenibacillus tarimensis TaxID=416012 RepID=UPI001F28C891|nr:MFS transporter [Paenibacillus tarimensis]MCF2945865.1 MFS transporter [Paenibacillus tarimensis]